MSAPNSDFVKACKAQPVATTPVWFMRQAGRYMPEYRAVRKQHSLLEICKKPALAAEVTVTAAEALGVDAAIIFADLLLPLEVMGLAFHFSAGEGPVIEKPLRGLADVRRLRSDGSAELGYVSDAVRLVAKHFHNRLPVITPPPHWYLSCDAGLAVAPLRNALAGHSTYDFYDGPSRLRSHAAGRYCPDRGSHPEQRK